jgi:hypothetical protein
MARPYLPLQPDQLQPAPVDILINNVADLVDSKPTNDLACDVEG